MTRRTRGVPWRIGHGRRRALGAAAAVALLAGLALAAVPGSAATQTELDGTCAVSGPATESGSVLISHPMLPQITGADLPITVATTTEVPDAINPGHLIHVAADVELDLSTIATDVLEQRVKPGVIAAGFPTLAPSAWVELDLHAVTIDVAHPAGTVATGIPSASSPASATTAGWTPDSVRLTIDHLSVDTRAPQPPATARLAWTVSDGGDPPPRTLTFDAGAVTFEATVSVGLLFYDAPVVGAVSAPWTCHPNQQHAGLAAVEVVSDPVPSTTAPTSTSSTLPTSTTMSTSTTSTTWPAAPTIPPDACRIDGFDAYGGFTGVALDATGYFRTERVDDRWWLVDPDGHPFFSQGINHATFVGTPDKYGATPYHDAAVARYGTQEAWADAQVERMDAWGYNTLGAWSDDVFFDDKPYVLLLGLTGQDFATGRMQDLFEPAWETGVRAQADAAAAVHADNSMLVGYWSDNELHFGPDWRELHLFDDYLARPATAAGKQALLTFLQDRYPSFEAFADDVTTTATSWSGLEDPSSVTGWTTTGGEATRAAWVGAVAERYFSVTEGAVRDADPNHLFFGPRFLAQTTGTPVLAAAARHVDVASFNLYPLRPELIEPLRNADPTYLPVDDALAAQAALLDKPILISEWSFRAADSGLPNKWPPLFPTLETQAQRAGAYEAYVQALLATDWVVGQHWFEHADEPPAGRFDGEDSNFGLVDNDDEPYPLLTAVSKVMHDCAYTRLLDPPPSSTTTTGPTPTSTAAPASIDGGGPTTSAAAPASAATVQPRFTG